MHNRPWRPDQTKIIRLRGVGADKNVEIVREFVKKEPKLWFHRAKQLIMYFILVV